MSSIPRTFCITLRETPKRKEESKRYFSQVGLSVEFFDGIHGESFGLKTTIPNYEIFPGREYFITQGQVGCILSHLMLWNILIHQPEDEFFIVEDDIILCEDFFKKFTKLKLELPADWEMVYVGWNSITGDESEAIKISENISTRKTECTHAYLVKKSALLILIETNQLAWNHIDNQIRIRSLPKLKYYTFEPSLVLQHSVKNIEDTVWLSTCYDWKTNPGWLKNSSNISVIMGTGWYPLEKNDNGYMIWSDGRGEFLLNDEWLEMQIDFICEGELEKKLTVICPSQLDQCFYIKSGINNIKFKINGAKSIILITDTFKPNEIYKTVDSRRLGIRLLKGITLTDNTEKSTFISLYSMYGQKKFNQSIKNDGIKTITPKYSYNDGCINLNNQSYHSHHRSGWEYVLNSLLPYHKEESTIFDGFLERNFAWQRDQNVQLRLIPYREPWVGVFHNPPNMPSWFSHNGTPNAIIQSREFQDSLGTCKGLYTLSKYHSNFLKCYIKNIPIETIYHPTNIPNIIFSYDEFIKNNNKKVINIGFWLRKLSSIYKLNVNTITTNIYQKIRLIFDSTNLEQILEVESSLSGIKLTDIMLKSVIDVRYMTNENYDDLLSKNIVFLDLYDSSANNVIIECIARGTPLLINPLPAIKEYLGDDYPFYFTNLDEASEKLNNIDLIKRTNKYLLTNENIKEKIQIEYFLKTIQGGNIWKSLL